MPSRKTVSPETFAHFVTFSCYKRRRLLTPDPCKRIAIGVLGSQLKTYGGYCAGFVIMPNHVHAVIWFDNDGKLTLFMDKWKELSSRQIYRCFERNFPAYLNSMPPDRHVWQRKCYDFDIQSEKKLGEKMRYMHDNPVRAGLATESTDWLWSSARYWFLRKPVGLALHMPFQKP